ncbi:MAG: folylpolyglutamate synthase/dihydrofolate synthase family protein [Gemmatimonadales bacterium]
MDSGLKSYRAALDELFARTGSTSKFGLERTFAFLELLGNPHEKIKTFHVAGTNGKGSVVATLYALLRSKNLSVGRYMSPHLIDFRERIVIDDAMVDEKYVVDFLERWSPQAEELGATFFEITTAMAFDFFASRNVDIAVIETGLGGRLDSTNVIKPIVAGITSIAIEHTAYLGKTEGEIAREKAGIFKPGIPSVIGDMSTNARVAIYESAAEHGVAAVVDSTRLFKTTDVRVAAHGTSFTIRQGGESARLTTGLVGAAQASNAAVALAMLRSAGAPWSVSLEEAAQVLPSVLLPGRFQLRGNYILDVAHNPDGVRSLVATLKQVKPAEPLTVVVGVLKDKDWRQMLSLLGEVADRIVLVEPPSAPADRAWDVNEAHAFAGTVKIAASIGSNFAQTVTDAGASSGTAIITGSFHTVGDALQVIKVA